MVSSLQRYMTQRQAQRARPVPPPPPRRTTAQPIVPTRRPVNTMAPPVRAPAVNTMAPPSPRPIVQPPSAPPTGMAQQAPVTAPGQMAPPPAVGQQAPAAPTPPPSLFKEPLAAEFAPTPNPLLGGMTPGDALGGGLTMKQPQPDSNPYGVLTPGEALGGGGVFRTQQMQQLNQLIGGDPDLMAQLTPDRMAGMSTEQIGQLIAKFNQSKAPAAPRYPAIRDNVRNPQFANMPDKLYNEMIQYDQAVQSGQPLSMEIKPFQQWMAKNLDPQTGLALTPGSTMQAPGPVAPGKM